VLDVAVQAGVVERSGSFFAFGEEGQAKTFLGGRPELVQEIAVAVTSPPTD
jgi:hypothetical protein